MAEAKVKKVEINLELVLTEHEAYYLRDHLAYAPYTPDGSEPSNHTEHRAAICRALTEALKNA